MIAISAAVLEVGRMQALVSHYDVCISQFNDAFAGTTYSRPRTQFDGLHFEVLQA